MSTPRQRTSPPESQETPTVEAPRAEAPAPAQQPREGAETQTPAQQPQQSSESQAPAPAPQQQQGAESRETSPDRQQENADANKLLRSALSEGIAGDIKKFLEAYGKLMEQIGMIGDLDIMNLIQSGLTFWQIEAEIKKQLEGRLIPSNVVAELRTNVREMSTSKAGEKPGDYILRCLGLKQRYESENEGIPPRSDGKPNDPTRISMIWLKLSGVMRFDAYNAIKEGFKIDQSTNKPKIYENDLVYMKTGENQHTAGFVREINFENDTIVLATAEGPKEFPMRQAFLAFHLAGNTEIMTSQREQNQQQQENRPAETPAAPASTPAAPANTPAAPANTPAAPANTPAAPPADSTAPPASS